MQPQIGPRRLRRGLGALMGVTLVAIPPGVRAQNWLGGFGAWTNSAMWSGGQVPGDGATVTVGSGTVILSTVTADLGSFTMTGGQLIFTNVPAPTNLTTILKATNVLITGGLVTHVANSATSTNELGQWLIDGHVYFQCSNFVLRSPGTVNVKARGWGSPSGGNLRGYGPGAGTTNRAGGGYGGIGGNQNNGGGSTYGTPVAPHQPGSGGAAESAAAGGTGGGAVRIEASGTVTIDGTINAGGNDTGNIRGGGSGGAVWISCAVFSGTNGTIRVVGGNCGYSGGVGGGGGGGRIAIHYNPELQGVAPPVSVTLLASRGPNVGGGYLGDIGTIYLSDTTLLKENLDFIEGQIFGPTSWSPPSLTISNRWVRFAEEGFTLSVSNDIVVQGTTGWLELGGAAVAPRGIYLMYSHDMDGSGTFALGRFLYSTGTCSLLCGGHLILTNNGRMRVYAGLTNAPGGYGALVDVKGDLYVGPNSWVYPVSNPTNGGSPLFRAANVTVAESGGFNASQLGFGGGGGGRTNGYGPGPGTPSGTAAGGGGGHGGVGGGYYETPRYGGGTYGISNAPIVPGSGGGRGGTATGYADSGGSGGGVIRLEVANVMLLHGVLKADGRIGGVDPNRPGGGGGGSIYIQCRELRGTGILQANGGNTFSGAGGLGGAGGGGRIAVVSNSRSGFTGTAAADGGTGGKNGDPGTVVWIDRSASGTVFLIR